MLLLAHDKKLKSMGKSIFDTAWISVGQRHYDYGIFQVKFQMPLESDKKIVSSKSEVLFTIIYF